MVLVGLVLICGWATYQRNFVWKDDFSLWSDVIKKSPEKFRGYYSLGTAFTETGQYDSAIKQYNILLKYESILKSNDILALLHNNLGTCYLNKGLIDNAIEEFRHVIKIKPDHLNSHFNLGIAYGRKGLIDEAISQYKIVIKLKPDFAEAYNNLGICYLEKGQFELAVNNFKQAIEIMPDYSEAMYNLMFANSKLIQIQRY